MLNVFTASARGLVPPPTTATGLFLKDDASWAAPGTGGGSGPLNNVSATTAPTLNDDSADGYVVFSRWLNTTTNILYVARDVSVGAAVWVRDDDTDTDTTPSLAAVANIGRIIPNANSQANGFRVGSDLNADGDFLDTNEGGKTEWYDSVLGLARVGGNPPITARLILPARLR